MAYGRVSVTVEHEDTELTIVSKRSDEEISLSCFGVDEEREVSGSVRDVRQPALLSSVRCQGASESEPQDHTTDP